MHTKQFVYCGMHTTPTRGLTVGGGRARGVCWLVILEVRIRMALEDGESRCIVHTAMALNRSIQCMW